MVAQEQELVERTDTTNSQQGCESVLNESVSLASTGHGELSEQEYPKHVVACRKMDALLLLATQAISEHVVCLLFR